MKTLKIFVWFMLATASCRAQDQNKPAGDISDLIQTEFPASNRPPDWNTRPPEAGKIRLYAEVLLREAKGKIEGRLNSVPDGEEGKGNILYAKITQWLQKVDQILLDGSRTNLLQLNGLHAEVFANANHRESVDSSIMSVVAEIHNLSKALIYNMGDFLIENQNPSVEQHDEMIGLFCISTFFQESEWEEDQPPIDPSGVFVMDAVNATTKLKTKNLEKIRTFLGGSTDSSFFERYEVAGDGMAILKTKYVSDKAAIQAKFEEVIAYVAQLESQE